MRRVRRRERGARREVSGDLRSLSLAEICQTLTLGAKTARVTLKFGASSGQIWFQDGQARHARMGRLEGERAFYHMLSWKRGRFVIEHGVVTGARTLTHDAMYLVLEGMRRLDERPPSREPTAPERGPQAGELRWGRDSVLLALAAAAAALGALTLLERVPAADAAASVASPRGIARAVRGPVPPAQAAAWSEQRDFTDWPWDWRDLAPELRSPRTPAPVREGPEAETPPRTIEAPAPEPAAMEAHAEAPPVGVEVAAIREAFLALSGKSLVKHGRLTVFVNGDEVYSTTLERRHRGAKRFFRKMVGKAGDPIDETIVIAAGEVDVLARLEVTEGSRTFENSVRVSLEPGETRNLRLVAGRAVGHPLRLEVE